LPMKLSDSIGSLAGGFAGSAGGSGSLLEPQP